MGGTPGDWGVHFNRGNAHYYLGDARARRGEEGAEAFRLAEKDFHATLRLEPRFWETHVRLGLLHETTGRLEDGLRSYGKGLAANPDAAPVRYRRAVLALLAGDEAAAEADAERMIRAGKGEGHYVRGLLEDLRGNPEKAGAAFREAFRCGTHRPWAVFHMQRVHTAGTPMDPPPSKSFEELADWEKDTLPGVGHRLLAGVLSEEEAEAWRRRHRPRDGAYAFYLGVHLARKGAPGPARAHLERAAAMTALVTEKLLAKAELSRLR
jgi:tetratricopeptide (TPR) repeat protein